MIDEVLFDNLDTLDDINTSDIDSLNETSEGFSEFYNSFIMNSTIASDDLEEYDGISSGNNPFDEDIPDEMHANHANHKYSPSISFGGGTHCMEYHCGCQNFEGTFGSVCTNCHHGYDKHF